MILFISRAAYDEIAGAIRAQVRPDCHDAWFTRDGVIDMDQCELTAGDRRVPRQTEKGDESGYVDGEPPNV
jgi:hypothetical protein